MFMSRISNLGSAAVVLIFIQPTVGLGVEYESVQEPHIRDHSFVL